MNKVVYLKALADRSVAPCLALVDLQQEYVTTSRLMSLPQAAKALDNCRLVLRHARASGFPVAFFRQVSRSPFFNPGTEFASWIPDFAPTGGDMVFEREQPSCYSNKAFERLMNDCGGHFVMAGFAGETSCLSTAIEAYHHDHQFVYLSDASASHAVGSLDSDATQSAVAELVAVYGTVLDTASWISATTHHQSRAAEHT